MSHRVRLLALTGILLATSACMTREVLRFQPILGFDASVNAKLAAFFERTRNVAGRKVAVFDGDGTTLGQAPHYLADECLYLHAQAHPERKPELLAKMGKMNNVSVPYLEGRVHYLAGMTVQEVRDLGTRCLREHYAGKVFEPMRRLVAQLQARGFEVWIVSGSPQVLYQDFYVRELGIPMTRFLGVQSTIEGGVVTDAIVTPVPQDHGKTLVIETFIQARPLLVGGNSRGDKEMIEHSADLKLIVNPDAFVAHDQTESMEAYARRQGWLVVRVRDVPSPGFPAVTSKVYGVRTNASHVVP